MVGGDGVGGLAVGVEEVAGAPRIARVIAVAHQRADDTVCCTPAAVHLPSVLGMRNGTNETAGSWSTDLRSSANLHHEEFRNTDAAAGGDGVQFAVCGSQDDMWEGAGYAYIATYMLTLHADLRDEHLDLQHMVSCLETCTGLTNAICASHGRDRRLRLPSCQLAY